MASHQLPGGSFVDEAGAGQSQLLGEAFINETGGGEAPVDSDLSCSYAITSEVSSDLSATYDIDSSVTSVSSDIAAAYGVESFVSSSLDATYDVAGTPASGSFITDAWMNNTDTPYGAVGVSYTWIGLGRIGSLTGKTLTEGTGTLSSGGVLTATGLPAGVGFLLGAVLGANAAADAVFYQAGTVA